MPLAVRDESECGEGNQERFLGSTYLAQCSYRIYNTLRPDSMCGTTLGAETLSPDGRHKAVIYEFSCGAMDPFTTQVSILKTDEEIPFSGGHVFGSSRGNRRGLWNGPYAELEWVSSSHLVVRYISDTSVQVKNELVNGVQISYETL